MTQYTRLTKAELLDVIADLERQHARTQRELKKASRENDQLAVLLADGDRDMREAIASIIAEASASAAPRTKTWYSHPAVIERAQAAHARTNALYGGRSWSEFVETALVRETLALEHRHNDGEQFEPMKGAIRPGRSAVNRSWGSKPRTAVASSPEDPA